MTNDELIGMAEKAGFKRETTLTYGYPYTAYKANIEQFAALVAAHERNECAKVCDDWPDYDVQGLAESIRARGEK